jgi:hypothetical protein
MPLLQCAGREARPALGRDVCNPIPGDPMDLFENVQDYPLLSADESARVATTVHELRPHWIQRRPSLPFYTLGVASYLDAVKDPHNQYYLRAHRLNDVLVAHFGWLYDRLAQHFTQVLGNEVLYRPGCGRPGFHIFQWCPEFDATPASVHKDGQYELIEWMPDEEPDFQRPLSFTLAITLPSYGGGLNVWAISKDEVEGLAEKEFLERVAAAPMEYHPYQVGTLVAHSGHKVHQIATGQGGRDGDERLTLQGHGIFCDGAWHLYW